LVYRPARSFKAAGWEVRGEYLLVTSHRTSLQRADLMDLAGDGVDKLVVESDFGGVGTAGSSLQVFDLSRGTFVELLNTYSRLESEDQEGYIRSSTLTGPCKPMGSYSASRKRLCSRKARGSSGPASLAHATSEAKGLMRRKSRTAVRCWLRCPELNGLSDAARPVRLTNPYTGAVTEHPPPALS
jgi:hypothetical protein